MSIKIIFIGTASGETSRTRNHSSILVQGKDHNLLIDCGDGISRALLNVGISFNSINTIILTHHHADHLAGLPSLLTQMKINKRVVPLQIFTHKNLIDSLNQLLITSYIFNEKFGFEFSLVPFDTGTKYKLAGDISFTTKQNSHIIRTGLLKDYPKELFVSSSLLLELATKKVFYTSDIGSPDDLFLFENEKLDWVISESTHIDFGSLFASYKKLGAGKLFLTHYSDETHTALIDKCKNLLPAEQANIQICYDGMTIDVD